MKVASVEEMRALDRSAIETYGIKDELLMENAGLAAYRVLAERFDVRGNRFLVFCGSGNNGGDGFVIARKIHAGGGLVKIFLLTGPDKYNGAARRNFEIIGNLCVQIEELKDDHRLAAELRRCHAVVDAIFGTGLTRDVGGIYRDVIEKINASGKPVLSVDIASGVGGDSGKVMGAAISADATVTFGLPKLGNLLYPGYELGGELYVTHISFPPQLQTAAHLKVQISPPVPLPPRAADGHKGIFGKALFVAGAAGYVGAPYFAALSFLKAGGGYSRLAAPQSIAGFIAAKGGEIVFIPQKETAAGSISTENEAALLELCKKMDIVVLGPGLSLAEETQQLARRLAAEVQKPLLIDGDGITAVCGNPDLLTRRWGKTILTPHLGEMARLTGRPVADIESDKISILQQASRKLNAVIVLKGAHSLIGLPDGRVNINLSGNSGMATAGSGDVLAGTIAAMYGLGLPPAEAALKGVYLHGLAGDLAAGEMGEDGITAQDILDYLPRALKTDRTDLPESLSRRYRGAQRV